MIISVSLCKYCKRRVSPKDETENYWTINVYVWLIHIFIMCEIYVKKLFFDIHVSEIQELSWEQCRNGQQMLVHQDVILFFFIMLNYFFGGSMYVSAMDLKHFKNVHTEATVMFSVHTMYCNEWGMRTLENILTLMLECKHFDFIFSGIISQVKWLLIEFYLIHIGWKDQFSWTFVLLL